MQGFQAIQPPILVHAWPLDNLNNSDCIIIRVANSNVIKVPLTYVILSSGRGVAMPIRPNLGMSRKSDQYQL